MNFSFSESFFNYKEPLAEPGMADFGSWRGRKRAILKFFQQISIIPLAFLTKLYHTFVSALGLGFAVFLLALTLCSEVGIREFFMKQMVHFAENLADWVLWPAAIMLCLIRLLLAATIHPALYFSV